MFLHEWLKQLWKWIQKNIPTEKPTIKIIQEKNSEHIRLLCLERGTSRSVRTWRGIFKSSSFLYDLLITCDDLQYVQGEKLVSKRPESNPTHRLGVFRVSRVPNNGRYPVDCIHLDDYDFYGFGGYLINQGYAKPITDSVALQLAHRSKRELQKLVTWNNEIERLEVCDRWNNIIQGYYDKYLNPPLTGSNRKY